MKLLLKHIHHIFKHIFCSGDDPKWPLAEMTFIRKAATSVHARNCLQKVIGALLMCAGDNEDCSCVDDKEVEGAGDTGEGFG